MDRRAEHPSMKMLKKENNMLGTTLHSSLPASQCSVHKSFRATASPCPCTGFRHSKGAWGSRVLAPTQDWGESEHWARLARAPGRAVWTMFTMKRRWKDHGDLLGTSPQWPATVSKP